VSSLAISAPTKALFFTKAILASRALPSVSSARDLRTKGVIAAPRIFCFSASSKAFYKKRRGMSQESLLVQGSRKPELILLFPPLFFLVLLVWEPLLERQKNSKKVAKLALVKQ